MSIAYPLTGDEGRSQSEDNLAAFASRHLEQHLGRTVGWYELVDHLKLARGKTHEQASHGALLATLRARVVRATPQSMSSPRGTAVRSQG